MNNTRRNFLKFAGLTAAGLCVASAGSVIAAGTGSTIKDGEKALKAKRWGMVIDTKKAGTKEAIDALAKACHSVHNVPDIPGTQNVKWIWAVGFEEAFDQPNNYMDESLEKRQFAVLCNHCSSPSCVRVCPTKATYQRPDGIVAMDYHRCIGCRYCMAACPFGARSFNFMEPRLHLDLANLNKSFPTRMRGVVEKCNFCVDRLADGKIPACVEASQGALVFGDLSDPASEVRKVLREHYTIRRKPALGTEPGVYYII
ncbi:MAG: 4Fe-4S dicluster domain-containing protein [Humidesulfovibrio sp.]|uniref:sulfate reduction electron transfer complex DsrMKJOP subunit DsrO n=1 Tax=Humidesulfovibrio sp. TaxID=2910988 RepID=UPI0027EFF364|nr:4Fe-4S dicluster domain-containing protein [Humidesulfovibrio sp.]MDQ7836061.1 4Fe-4S dicluster domain-containing protein [Humidesulfovibrio sp.]